MTDSHSSPPTKCGVKRNSAGSQHAKKNCKSLLEERVRANRVVKRRPQKRVQKHPEVTITPPNESHNSLFGCIWSVRIIIRDY